MAKLKLHSFPFPKKSGKPTKKPGFLYIYRDTLDGIMKISGLPRGAYDTQRDLKLKIEVGPYTSRAIAKHIILDNQRMTVMSPFEIQVGDLLVYADNHCVAIYQVRATKDVTKGVLFLVSEERPDGYVGTYTSVDRSNTAVSYNF